MERTQIYLSKSQTAALDREARRRGTTRSHLIREAIEARYGSTHERERVKHVLARTAGLWRDRDETAIQYVERLRSGRRLRELHGDGKPGRDAE